MYKPNKKYGLGTLSPILAIAAIIFSCLYINKLSIGEEFLNLARINIPDWIITLVVVILADFIGIKYKEHKFSKVGVVISSFYLGLTVLSLLIALIRYII